MDAFTSISRSDTGGVNTPTVAATGAGYKFLRDYFARRCHRPPLGVAYPDCRNPCAGSRSVPMLDQTSPRQCWSTGLRRHQPRRVGCAFADDVNLIKDMHK